METGRSTDRDRTFIIIIFIDLISFCDLFINIKIIIFTMENLETTGHVSELPHLCVCVCVGLNLFIEEVSTDAALGSSLPQ